MSEGNSNIATLLNQILTAIYGKDVRQSIHDAIQQCYSDVGDPVLNEAAFKKAVQEKIDDGSIGALTLGEGSIETKFIKNKAVTSEKIADDVTAKIDKNAMNIDSLKEDLSRLSADKIDKPSEDGIEGQVLSRDADGNTVWKDAMTELRDGTVTPEKTTFFTVNKEIVNLNGTFKYYNSTPVGDVSKDIYNLGLTYGGKLITLNCKAGKTYLFFMAQNSKTTTPPKDFRASRGDGYYKFIRLNDDGSLRDNYNFDYSLVPCMPNIGFRAIPPNFNTISGASVYFDGTYTALGLKNNSYLPYNYEGTEYYVFPFIFTANEDFYGITSIGSSGFPTFLYEYYELNNLDTEYNPYFDGFITNGGYYGNVEFDQEILNASLAVKANELLQKYNPLYGKKWCCCGDSLTQYAGGDCLVENEEDTGFITQIMRVTGISKAVNAGTAGQTWSSKTDGEFVSGSAVERVNSIVNGTEDYDIVTLAYGTNSDADGDGTVDDEPAYDGTMCAAVKWCIEQLVAWKPTVSIGIILPPKRADSGDSGNALMRTRGELIRSVAEQYGIKTCDMWAESGINILHHTNTDTGGEKYYYLGDMLHLSDYGKQKYAAKLKVYLNQIVGIY